MMDQVSQVGQAGASACWGRDHGFQVFNSQPKIRFPPPGPLLCGHCDGLGT